MALVEIKGDIMAWWRLGNVIGITTNGFVKRNGRAVMGAGIAKSMRDAIPGVDLQVGARIKDFGNSPAYFPEHKFFTFPVKHNWWEDADLELIYKSAEFINRNYNAGDRIDFPRPGCGNGKLEWKTVKPVLEKAFSGHKTVCVWDW